jgi:hypothetical protein
MYASNCLEIIAIQNFITNCRDVYISSFANAIKPSISRSVLNHFRQAPTSVFIPFCVAIREYAHFLRYKEKNPFCIRFNDLYSFVYLFLWNNISRLCPSSYILKQSPCIPFSRVSFQSNSNCLDEILVKSTAFWNS